MSQSKDQMPRLDAITPGADEPGGRRRSSTKQSRRAAPKQSSFNGMLVFVIVLMAIVMGVGGYTLFEVQKKLERSNVLLAKGQENMIELERRLNATGTDVSKTLTDVQSQLETNGSEIRKLWDVSNKRNRQWIEENQTAITSLGSSISSIEAKANKASQDMQVVVQGFKGLDQEMTRLRDRLIEQSNEIETQVSLLRGQVQDQVVEQKGLARQLTLATERLERTEEAIEAIDQHRRQLNSRISELQTLVRELQGAGKSPGT